MTTGIMRILFVILWLVLIILLYFSVFNSWMYWLILLGWIIAIRQFKIDSKVTFILTFLFFTIAATVTSFGQEISAEIIMRISFIGLLIGFIQALMEFKKLSETDNL